MTVNDGVKLSLGTFKLILEDLYLCIRGFPKNFTLKTDAVLQRRKKLFQLASVRPQETKLNQCKREDLNCPSVAAA